MLFSSCKTSREYFETFLKFQRENIVHHTLKGNTAFIGWVNQNGKHLECIDIFKSDGVYSHKSFHIFEGFYHTGVPKKMLDWFLNDNPLLDGVSERTKEMVNLVVERNTQDRKQSQDKVDFFKNLTVGQTIKTTWGQELSFAGHSTSQSILVHHEGLVKKCAKRFIDTSFNG